MIAVIYWTQGSANFRLVNKPGACVEVRGHDALGAENWLPARDARKPEDVLGIALGVVAGSLGTGISSEKIAVGDDPRLGAQTRLEINLGVLR